MACQDAAPEGAEVVQRRLDQLEARSDCLPLGLGVGLGVATRYAQLDYARTIAATRAAPLPESDPVEAGYAPVGFNQAGSDTGHFGMRC